MKKIAIFTMAALLLLTLTSQVSAQWAWVETLSVNSQGTVIDGTPVVTSSALETGRLYRFEVSGTFDATAPSEAILCDAEYVTYDHWTTPLDILNPPYDGYGEGLCELKVDGGFVEWGPYDASHVYTMDYTGTGSTVDFQIYDLGGGANNSGSLTVDIYVRVADIEKTVDPVGEVELGDHLDVELVVDNPYDDPVTVVDAIPDGLAYIPGTFYVDTVLQLEDPSVVDNMLITTVATGNHTLEFELQVVEVGYEDATVTNTAAVYAPGIGDPDDTAESDEIILSPYDGFSKEPVFWFPMADWDYVPWHTFVYWGVLISVEDIADEVTMTGQDVLVKDNLGGDLTLYTWNDIEGEYVQDPNPDWNPDGGAWTAKEKGKTKKIQFTWELDAFDGYAELGLVIGTDVNPGQGKKVEPTWEYTSIGLHDLNSGATLKFTDPDTGLQLSAHTGPLTVEAYEPEIMLP